MIKSNRREHLRPNKCGYSSVQMDPCNHLLHHVNGEPTNPKSLNPLKSKAPLMSTICLSRLSIPPVFSSAFTILLKSPTQSQGRFNWRNKCLSSAQECSRLAVTGFP
ncbi:hypothetical protein ACB098_02G110400 [Castanea mollissima]